MIGAIIGDLAGSVYEYEQIKKVKPININNKELITDNSFISDDTILTMAILKAVLTDKNYEQNLKDFAIRYETMMPNFSPYFKTIFSIGFSKWLHGNFQGNSIGNGAMMRISPIGYFFNNIKDIEKNSYLATIPSHNSSDSINSATLIAKIIFYARQGLDKRQIIQTLNLNIQKPILHKFNVTCNDTIDICLYSLFTSNNFENSIKTALSFGGDTDTNACITGSMAEALYGINDELKRKALNHLPSEFVDLLDLGYSKIKNIKNPINNPTISN